MHLAHRFACALVLLACTAEAREPGSAEYQQAFSALFTKDYARMVEYARKGADLGNVDAMRLLADAYAEGNGVASNHSEALKWYRQGAANGEGGCLFYSGYYLVHGENVARDEAAAARAFQQVIDRAPTDKRASRFLARAKEELAKLPPGSASRPEPEETETEAEPGTRAETPSPPAPPPPTRKPPRQPTQAEITRAWYNGRPLKTASGNHKQLFATGRAFQKYGENADYYQVASFDPAADRYTLVKIAKSAGVGYHREQVQASAASLGADYRQAALPQFCDRCKGSGSLAFDELESAGMGTTYVSGGGSLSDGVYATRNYKTVAKLKNCIACNGSGLHQ